MTCYRVIKPICVFKHRPGDLHQSVQAARALRGDLQMSDENMKTVAYLHGRVQQLEAELASANELLAEHDKSLVEMCERYQGDQMRLLRKEVDKWKEIAEENAGEHIRAEYLRDKMRGRTEEWLALARRSNDPKSPSIWVDCSEDLVKILEHQPPLSAASVVFEKARKWDAIQAWLKEREVEPRP